MYLIINTEDNEIVERGDNYLVVKVPEWHTRHKFGATLTTTEDYNALQDGTAEPTSEKTVFIGAQGGITIE